MGYDVTIADDREEYTRAGRFPEGASVVRTERDYALGQDALRPGRDRYVAIVSRCWETDLAAIRPWLSPEAPPARYIGLIGSERKVRGVFDRLRAEGTSAERIARVRAPIGLSIGALTPEEIAVSILAQMTAVRRAGRPAGGDSQGVPARSGTAPEREDG